jgi:hypothetical protein
VELRLVVPSCIAARESDGGSEELWEFLILGRFSAFRSFLPVCGLTFLTFSCFCLFVVHKNLHINN